MVCYIDQNGVLYAPERCVIRTRTVWYTHHNGVLYAPERYAIRTRTVWYTHQNGVLYAQKNVLYACGKPGLQT